MAAFKDEFSAATIATLGDELVAAEPGFPAERFLHLATTGLGDLELMARVTHVAKALTTCLPDGFAEAAAVLHRALDSPTFTGWITLPCGTFVAESGIDTPDIALPLLAALSPRFSSEGPIRPFIEQHPELTFGYLHRWIEHPDEHVRRLVSEGTRPRLPWARQLRGLIEDPSPSIELLDRLFDDPSEYVRRSVANHLNDISKDHPEVAIACAKRWTDASTHGDWVARHGLRSLVKKGEPEALAVLGFDLDNEVVLTSFEVEPTTVSIGEAVTLTATFTAPETTRTAIDFIVHYQGVAKRRNGKVFKLTVRTIEPDSLTVVSKRHAFKHVSIRHIHPGVHQIDIQANGRVLASRDILVTD